MLDHKRLYLLLDAGMSDIGNIPTLLREFEESWNIKVYVLR